MGIQGEKIPLHREKWNTWIRVLENRECNDWEIAVSVPQRTNDSDGVGVSCIALQPASERVLFVPKPVGESNATLIKKRH